MVLYEAERALERLPFFDPFDPFLPFIMTSNPEPELIGEARSGCGCGYDAPDRHQATLRENAPSDRDSLTLDASTDEYPGQSEPCDQGFERQAGLLES